MTNAPARAKPRPAKKPPVPSYRTRPFWLRQLRQWHWISAAISLIGLALFAVTGITLNHAAQIAAEPVTTRTTVVLPAPLRAVVAAMPEETEAPAPTALARWAHEALKVEIAGRPTETSAEEIYIALPRPGGDGGLTIDRATGQTVRETTTRGWVAYLNDLHKGRNTGAVWAWFIDIFAVVCVVSALTGLALLYLLATGRRWTWPLVGLGVLIPVVLAVVFIH